MLINIASFTNRAVIDDPKMVTKYKRMFLVYFDKTTEQIENQFYNCDVKKQKSYNYASKYMYAKVHNGNLM